ncbi:MAG: glycosyltransferase [Lachnospiraceae bacterium]|nr:glycosyltransferase [Lachnospiraceae bacterium]
MEQIEKLVVEEKWEAAAEAFLSYLDVHSFSERLSILGATIAYHIGDVELAFLYIHQGLELNIYNYELYLVLGDCYAMSNPNQAYLCYENALYFCERDMGENHEDTIYIRKFLESYKENEKVSVKPASFVILSWNTKELTAACIESVKNTCYKDAYELILIDNGSIDGSVEYLKSVPNIKTQFNEKNFGFAGGCNQGIKMASEGNDIFLLNSDAEMMPNALFLLRLGLYANESVGAVGAIANYVGNSQKEFEKITSPKEAFLFCEKHNLPEQNKSEEKAYLVGFAELIKSAAMNKIGGLNEDYPIGNYEDNDFGLKMVKNGYRNYLLHNVFIFHWGSESFVKNKVDYMSRLEKNALIFRDKWGIDASVGETKGELLSIIPKGAERVSFLQIDCGMGGFLSHLKYQRPNWKVYGTESDKRIEEIGYLELPIEFCDVSNEELPFDKTSMDYILIDETLEKQKNPEDFIQRLLPYMKDNGKIIFYVKNSLNAKNIFYLLHGKTVIDRDRPYTYSCQELIDLIENQGLNIEDIKFSMKPGDTTKDEPYVEFFDYLLKEKGIPDRQEFDTYKFLIMASLK